MNFVSYIKNLIKNTKIFVFSVFTIINTCINLSIFSTFLFLSEGNFVSVCYFVSSLLTILFAYFMNKYLVFKSKKNGVLRFFLGEIFLVFLTIILFELYNLFIDQNIYISYISIYGTRLILAYIFAKSSFEKS